MKITIYELLGLIKEGKAPKKIKIAENIYEFDEDYNFYTTQGTYENMKVALGGKHGEINLLANAFNENVEIIEEQQEEEFTGWKLFARGKEVMSCEYSNEQPTEDTLEEKTIQELKNKRFTRNQKQIAGKINELVRAINSIKKEK